MVALGLMSGSSLDGVDLCLAEFTVSERKWGFSILNVETYPYPEHFLQKLKHKNHSGIELLELHQMLGEFYASLISTFLATSNKKPEIIGLHGHTYYHAPSQKLSIQLGEAQAIASKLNIPVISDFRKADVQKGGQGAPLVPIGDALLFSDYEACVNFGGYCNLSFNNKLGNRIAFDVCACNKTLNHLANSLGFAFDKNGEIAKSGTINQTLLHKLNSDSFFNLKGPKSLSDEWLHEQLKKIDSFSDTEANKLATNIEHITIQVARALQDKSISKILCTGGGSKNTFLINRLKANYPAKWVVPSIELIDGKEALIFAFLATLRKQEEVNIWSTYTGANANSVAGVLYIP